MNQALRITIPSFIFLYILLKKLDFMGFSPFKALVTYQSEPFNFLMLFISIGITLTSRFFCFCFRSISILLQTFSAAPASALLSSVQVFQYQTLPSFLPGNSDCYDLWLIPTPSSFPFKSFPIVKAPFKKRASTPMPV